MHNKISAFTLVELLVTIAVGAIVLAIGVPSFQNLMQTNQLATQTNKFISSLNYARSEAVKRKLNVIICTSSSPNNCDNSNDYESGWFIFVDTDLSGSFNNSPGNEDVPLWQSSTLSNGLTLRGNANIASQIVFNSRGRPSTNGSLILCADDDLTRARRIVVPLSGNVRLAESNANGIPIDNDGTEIGSCT